MKNVLNTLVLLFLLNCSGPSGTDKKTIEKVNAYLLQLERAGFHGSVLVEIDGDKILSHGYGFSDFEKQIKNSTTSLFDIGSITKQFTASAILKLEMRGALSTDDQISKYFENIPPDKQGITIHDLLRHQSGLISNVGRDYEKISESEFLDKVFASKLLFTPGSDFSYSNTGYSLLALIIERVSKETYETFLFENLWKPAQMHSTGYRRPAFDIDRIAVGYDNDGRVWGKPTEKSWDDSAPYLHLKGNGGVLSTTEDLLKWHKCLSTESVLSNNAMNKLYNPKLRTAETGSSFYAYGWDVSKTSRNTTQIWHNGSNNIFYADFLRLIDENIVVIMLSNKSNQNFNNLNFEIAKIILNPSYHPDIPAPDNEENRAFTNRIIKTVEDSGLEAAKADYRKRKQSEQIIEFKMRQAGFECLDSGKPEVALRIFEMNVFAYPNSAKALQGLGEGYMESGKKESALKYFQESLRMDPENPFVSSMINKLGE